MRKTYAVYGQHIGEEKKQLFVHATKSICERVRDECNEKENDSMYAWVEQTRIPSEEDFAEDENKITVVINFGFDDQAVRGYVTPRLWNQTSYSKIDKKIEAWINRSLDTLETVVYCYKGVSYWSLEELYKVYSKEDIDPYY